MVAAGDAIRRKMPKSKTIYYEIVPSPEPSESKPSPTSMSAKDTLAYVGLGDVVAISRAHDKMGEYELSSPRHNQWPLAPLEIAPEMNPLHV
jgi:hypothetical protein